VAFPVAALQRVGLSGMVIGWARLLGRRYHSTDNRVEWYGNRLG